MYDKNMYDKMVIYFFPTSLLIFSLRVDCAVDDSLENSIGIYIKMIICGAKTRRAMSKGGGPGVKAPRCLLRSAGVDA